MTAELTVLAIAVGLVVAALVFRVSSVLLFLAIATGVLLQQSLGESTALAIAGFVESSYVNEIAYLTLLGLPVALTLLVSRRTLGRNVFLHLLPLVLAAMAAAVLAIPHLSTGVQGALFASPWGKHIDQMSDVIVAGAAVLNLLLAWRIYRHRDDKHHHGK